MATPTNAGSPKSGAVAGAQEAPAAEPAGMTTAGAAATSAFPAPRRFVLPAFIFAHFAHHVGTGGLAPLLPLIRQAFELDYARSGLLLSAQGLALGFGQLPISALADRFSKRLMIAIGLIGVGLAGIAISLSTSFIHLIPLLVVTGLMAATYHAPAASYLAGTFSAIGRGRALGTHVIGGAVAFSAVPAIAIGVVQLTGSWRTAFLALAIAPLVAGVMMLLLTWRNPDARLDGAAAHTERAAQVKAFAALKAIGPLVAVALAEQLLTASMFAYIPLFLVDRHGVAENRAGLFIALITGIGIIAAPLGGALSDRFGRAPVLVTATASVGPLILLFAYVPFGWPIVVVLLLYGLSMNTRLPVLESLFADAIPAQRRSTVLGLYYFIGQETASVTTPLVGRLIDVTSPVQAMTLLGIAGTVFSLGLLVTRRRLVAPR
ncbi:MAG: MFS transporter [Chloroflexi bacterium]|nr:MFS transporter [Chloroflexota bacterium]